MNALYHYCAMYAGRAGAFIYSSGVFECAGKINSGVEYEETVRLIASILEKDPKEIVIVSINLLSENAKHALPAQDD